MKTLFALLAALLLLAGQADARERHAKPRAAAKGVLPMQGPPQRFIAIPGPQGLTSAEQFNVVYLSGLAPVGIVSSSDTTFWCDNAAGCGPGVDLKRIGASQISQFVLGSINTLAPLSYSGGSFFLNIDSTLQVIGNQLHVAGGGGGGGFPITLGTTPIMAGSTTTTVANLNLTNPGMSVPTGTPVSCLALDGSGKVIAVPVVGGSCGGGGPPGTHFRLTNSNGLRLSNTNGFRLTNGS